MEMAPALDSASEICSVLGSIFLPLFLLSFFGKSPIPRSSSLWKIEALGKALSIFHSNHHFQRKKAKKMSLLNGALCLNSLDKNKNG